MKQLRVSLCEEENWILNLICETRKRIPEELLDELVKENLTTNERRLSKWQMNYCDEDKFVKHMIFKVSDNLYEKIIDLGLKTANIVNFSIKEALNIYTYLVMFPNSKDRVYKIGEGYYVYYNSNNRVVFVRLREYEVAYVRFMKEFSNYACAKRVPRNVNLDISSFPLELDYQIKKRYGINPFIKRRRIETLNSDNREDNENINLNINYIIKKQLRFEPESEIGLEQYYFRYKSDSKDTQRNPFKEKLLLNIDYSIQETQKEFVNQRTA